MNDHAASGRSRKIALLLAALVCIVVLWINGGRCLTWLGGALDVGLEPQESDYVMLLNGDRNTRPFKVADLILQGMAPHALITTTVDDPESSAPKYHEVTQQILFRCGVSRDQVTLIDSRVMTTFDEAKTLKTFLEEKPGITVSVVTNEYHTRRSRWVFAKVLGPKMGQIRFVSAPTDRFNANNWWKNETGFTLYLSEFFKFGFYQFKYGSGLVWISAMLGSLVTIEWYRRRRRSARSTN